MNIVLVAIDTLRADHMGCYEYGRATSPHLDALAAEGVLFENFFAPGIPTQPSYTTLYTGQYPITHGIVSHGGSATLAPQAPFVTEDLRRAGYHTAAVDDLRAYKPWFGRGYVDYLDPTPPGPFTGPYTSEQVNAVALPWLAHRPPQPFFLFVHYWEPHTPYLPPEPFRSKFYSGDPTKGEDTLAGLRRQPLGERWAETWFKHLPPGIVDAEYLVALYDGEIAHMDEAVGALVASLDETGLAEDTLIILLSDHGEVMYKHDIYFDHHGLYDDNLHVPLIVRWPGRTPAGLRVSPLAQHVDLAPTLLEACGLPVPPTMEGTSLLPLLAGASDAPIHDCLVSEECSYQKKWAIRADGFKFILSRAPDWHGGPPEELYDLRADPQELENIAGARPDVADALRSRLEAWIADMMARNGLERDPLVTQDLTLGKGFAAWLKERGYR